MSSSANKSRKIKKIHFIVTGILLLILLAVSLLWFNYSNSVQSGLTLDVEVYFKGEYRIADGPWIPYVEGEHIPATKGEVTLRGNFYKRYEGEDLGAYIYDPSDDNADSLKISFYTNHINLTFCEIVENGETNYLVSDSENPLYGDSQCGKSHTVYPFDDYGPRVLVGIVINNPHAFGNETAIDEMLSNMALRSGIEFEKGILERGETERNAGIMIVMASIMLWGIALFSSLIHIKNSKIIWLLGGLVLFAGIYFSYNADGVDFWSDSIVLNTTVIGASMMLYMFFLAMFSVCFMTAMRRIGTLAVVLLGIANAVLFLLPIISDILFYDLWIWWIAVQMIANVVLAICLVKEFLTTKTNKKWLYTGALLPIIAFGADVFGVGFGIWKGGRISQYVFVALLAIAIVTVLKLIPSNINAARKAKELEMEKIVLNAELSESRISTMMSQIRPHFIYNTLGSIEQLCMLDPPKAGNLVHNLAKYLRGNFGELDNPKPILMSQEMEHVHHYISIENVRFPDMTFTFEMNSEDFYIPALTVQPIVENAIKHGLMKLTKGGTITVVSYETDEDYCVSVVDDGVGFDTNATIDNRKHLGLRNIRERLRVMVNGTLEIESTVGVDTKVLIKIPKEVQK